MTTDALGAQPAPELPEFTRVGPYRLVQQLGEGGMGVVHLALDRSGRAVAVKVLRPHVAADPGARTRLRREVETLSRIRHPNVAPIVDHDVSAQLPYVVTRYIAGPALDDVVEQNGPLRGAALLQLGRGLAGALHAIHEAGVIHRDVKPGNVLLLDGEPVLIDFGIAHVADDIRLTRTGLVMGTPGYLSPEVVEGAEVTESTDWWGWAATLGFAASGRPPFGRGSMESVLSRVVRGEADLSGVDPDLVPLLDAALSPCPEDRPTDTEVLRALERFAEGGAVTDVLRTPRRQVELTRPVEARPTAVLPAVQPAPVAAPVLRANPAQQATAPPPPAGLTDYERGYSSPEPYAGRSAFAEPAPANERDRRGRGATAYAPGAGEGAPYRPDPAQVSYRPGEGAAYGPGEPTYGPDGRPMPPRPPMAGDPRIGRTSRAGVLLALAGCLIALAASYPAAALAAAVFWSILARTADRSVTSLVLRRHSKGARSSDVAISVLTSPIHLLSGIVATLAASLIPAAVGLAGVFACLLGFRMIAPAGDHVEYAVALAAGMALTLMMAWWGPGGAGLRRGSRSLARGLAPGNAGAQLVGGLLAVGAAGLILWSVLNPELPTWWPFSGVPNLFSSLTAPPR